MILLSFLRALCPGLIKHFFKTPSLQPLQGPHFSLDFQVITARLQTESAAARRRDETENEDPKIKVNYLHYYNESEINSGALNKRRAICVIAARAQIFNKTFSPERPLGDTRSTAAPGENLVWKV